jgi:hypothetical protein
MEASLSHAHPEGVDFGSDQRCSVFATADIARLSRKNMNGFAIIAKKPERRSGPKDGIYGWAQSDQD